MDSRDRYVIDRSFNQNKNPKTKIQIHERTLPSSHLYGRRMLERGGAHHREAERRLARYHVARCYIEREREREREREK